MFPDRRVVVPVKRGVLVVNLGTPASSSAADVGVYLNEFLADSRVVDLPRWLWLPLLRLVIVPLRKSRSAEAYAKIWMEQGSPLLVNSEHIASALQTALGDEATVGVAMRYGEPSIERQLAELRAAGVTDLTVLPLYPQYSGTTTASVFDGVREGLASLAWQPQLHSVVEYYDDPEWVAAVADSIRAFQANRGQPDLLLFSLHGIPQRYVAAGDPYADQCRAGVALVAKSLGLAETDYQLTFQSRVGREPWLQPYTDKVLEELAKKGVKRVQVVCPGFAADCLETLEEIAMQNEELFVESGGEHLDYIPALNDSPAHVEMLANQVRTAWSKPESGCLSCQCTRSRRCRFPGRQSS